MRDPAPVHRAAGVFTVVGLVACDESVETTADVTGQDLQALLQKSLAATGLGISVDDDGRGRRFGPSSVTPPDTPAPASLAGPTCRRRQGGEPRPQGPSVDVGADAVANPAAGVEALSSRP